MTFDEETVVAAWSIKGIVLQHDQGYNRCEIWPECCNTDMSIIILYPPLSYESEL